MKLSPNHSATARALSHTHNDLILHMLDAGAPGNVLEIGTCAGGSALSLMALVKNQNHFLVTVDPWGDRPYATSGARYGNSFQRGALATLGYWANEAGVNWHHFKMDSIDFLRLIQPLGCWYNGRLHEYRWDTVFLDGEHTIGVVRAELDALVLNDGAVIFVDNANHGQPASADGAETEEPIERPWMREFLVSWAESHSMSCKFIACKDMDLLAELRSRV